MSDRSDDIGTCIAALLTCNNRRGTILVYLRHLPSAVNADVTIELFDTRDFSAPRTTSGIVPHIFFFATVGPSAW
jgi:hypothetical protein